jgi:hypothetical protein
VLQLGQGNLFGLPIPFFVMLFIVDVSPYWQTAVSGASEWVVALPVDRHLIMVFIALIHLAGGSFLDDLAFMILATPIFFPGVVRHAHRHHRNDRGGDPAGGHERVRGEEHHHGALRGDLPRGCWVVAAGGWLQAFEACRRTVRASKIWATVTNAT